MALACILGGCGPDAVVDGVALEGTHWRALMVAGLPPVVGHQPTLAHEGVVAQGFAGCNDYSWTYRSLPGGGISVAGLSQSERPCEGGDPALKRVEERFLDALKAAQRIDVVAGRLEIQTGLGKLVFERIEPSG